jgi:hypothetical protein
MIPLPAGVLKVVSPATYELYEGILPEVRYQRSEGRGQISEVGSQRAEGRGQRSEVGEQGTEVGEQGTEVGEQGTEVGDQVGRQWRSISINRHGTFRMLLKFLAYMGVFFIVLYFNPSGQKRAVPDFIFGLIWVIFFLGLFNALFSFLQEMPGMQIQWLRALAPPGIYLGTFKSPNNFSEFLEMVIPLTMGLLIVQNYAEVKKFSRRLAVKNARIAAFFSKTGLLSFGIIILIPALFFSLCRGMVVSYRLHDRYSFVLFGFVVAGGFVYLIWMGAEPVINELQNLFATSPTAARPQTYIEAIVIIKDFPLFGVGFGDWHDIIMKYHTMVGRETWMPAIAYNDTLQIAAETGFAGFACVAAFLFMIYKKAVAALIRERGVVNQALILGGITAMSAALIHCQFDYLFFLPSNAVVFMAISGMTYRLSIQSDKAEDRDQRSDVRGQVSW